jgi:hypothetical protein
MTRKADSPVSMPLGNGHRYDIRVGNGHRWERHRWC